MPVAKALLFDLGGVLVDIDFAEALRAWSAYTALPMEELRRRYAFDQAYERHERGQLSSADYFAHLASTLELDATPAQIEAGWNAIFRGECVPVRQLVEQARKRLPCYAFTNTNASHMACWSRLYPEVIRAFDGLFASHEIGMRKPERVAFEHICATIRVEPREVIFFDDLAGNVAAAEAVGMQGVVVRSVEDVARALRPLGVEAHRGD